MRPRRPVLVTVDVDGVRVVGRFRVPPDEVTLDAFRQLVRTARRLAESDANRPH